MTGQRFSLTAQIEGAERALQLLDSEWERLVVRGRMKQAERAYMASRLAQVIATLEWLKKNETAIRSALADRRGK